MKIEWGSLIVYPPDAVGRFGKVYVNNVLVMKASIVCENEQATWTIHSVVPEADDIYDKDPDIYAVAWEVAQGTSDSVTQAMNDVQDVLRSED